MVKEFSPDVVIGIQKADELERILTAIEKEGFKVLLLTSSPALRRRESFGLYI